MLNRLLIIAAVVALVALSGKASAEPVKGGVVVVAGDSTSKTTPVKEKSSKKKSDVKATKAARPTGDNLVEPDEVEEEDEGADQVWDTELFVNQDAPVLGEAPRVLTK